MAYKFGLLRMDVSAEADAHNREWLGDQTLGIEVTSVPLAKRCGLGNLDPQHRDNKDSSAIEEALVCPLPPDGSKLVTIRPDKDSVGAMAVLQIRLFRREASINKMLVSWIGVLDRLGYQGAVEAEPELALCFGSTNETGALNVIAQNERWQMLDDKVRDTIRILTGQMPSNELYFIANLRKSSRESFPVEMHEGLAFIEAPGKYRDARHWGNRNYDVVLVHDPKYGCEGGTCERWTLISKTARFDIEKFGERFNQAEAERRGISLERLGELGLDGGGNRNIFSSPQGRGRESKLDKRTILGIALGCFSTTTA